mgnify:CR=1 FL=1
MDFRAAAKKGDVYREWTVTKNGEKIELEALFEVRIEKGNQLWIKKLLTSIARGCSKPGF